MKLLIKEAQERRTKPMIKAFSLNAASFDVNSSELKEQAKRDIKKMAQDIKNYEFRKITIEGHTDSTGSKELNKRLSEARARAVYDEFIKHGIPSYKMEYVGFGSSMPRATNATPEGRALNRRTEVFVE